MKIAILYICTGRYTLFWPGFYDSAKKFLLPRHEKHFFVFSDADPSEFAHDDVSVIFQENLGWPNNTLKRFHMFLRAEEKLKEYDYIFFFNANCVLKDVVGEEILPSEDEALAAVRHPGFFNKRPSEFTYDRNPESMAYIPMDEGEYYVAGGFNGGIAKAFLQLCRELVKAVDANEAKGVVALWHDESHLNHYLLNKKFLLLSPSYCYPENWTIPFKEIIMVRDKAFIGGAGYLRGQDSQPGEAAKPIRRNVFSRFCKRFKNEFRRMWYSLRSNRKAGRK